ncbi:PulJ/GspJ family protein [Heyndrickxia coagulans]|uniref:PulJ/GspJ family protein n=1 Tax=Heyndrickxia coagulans TaxID=1398 RepID=UPI002E1D6CF7|nr:prepilin-type N-terminal cleavage/methylation domain-containing protein [Heyndrickxia coagulans]
MKKPLFKNSRGFTLVEVLASITILAIVMLTVGAILANNAGVTKKADDSQYFSGAVLDSIKMNTETAVASSSGTSGAAAGSSSGTGTSSTSAGSSSGSGTSKTASSASSGSDASKTAGGSSSGMPKTGSSSSSAASKTAGETKGGGSSSAPAAAGGTAGPDNAATGEAEGVTVYEATYTMQLNQAALNAAGKKEEQQ